MALLATDPSPDPAYPIGSVDRALTVLLVFESTESVTVAEVADLLGVARSTAYRLLSLLEHRGFVRQDRATKTFHSGPALLRVGLTAVHRSDVRAHLRPLLEKVASEVDETSHIVVMQRGEVLFLDCVESSKVVRSTARVGLALPAHLTAGGKILLAQLPDDRVEAEVLSGELRPLTSRSKTTADAIRNDIAETRARGWALNDAESEPGLRAVALFVPGAPRYGSVGAALTVAGPEERLTDRRIREIVETVRRLRDEYLASGP